MTVVIAGARGAAYAGGNHGRTCLDEVAWRHGLESRELLEQLEAITDA